MQPLSGLGLSLEMDEDLFDEFGNYIGPEVDQPEEPYHEDNIEYGHNEENLDERFAMVTVDDGSINYALFMYSYSLFF